MLNPEMSSKDFISSSFSTNLFNFEWIWWFLVKIDFEGAMLAAEELKFYLKNNGMSWQLRDMLINSVSLLMFESCLWWGKAASRSKQSALEKEARLLTGACPGLELLFILLDPPGADILWNTYSGLGCSILLLHINFFLYSKSIIFSL